MLDALFTMPAAIRRFRSNLLGPWLDSFADRLCDRGYTPWSCRSKLTLAADLGRWMADRDSTPATLDEDLVDGYVEERRTQPQRRRWAASHLLAHLREEGVAPTPRILPDRSPVTLLCQRYARYLREERGAADGTVEGYVAVVRRFLCQRFDTGAVDVEILTPQDVGDHLLSRAVDLAPRRMEYLSTALRSFLRYLFVRGDTPTDLSRSVLGPMKRHLATVPRYLTPEEVKAMLSTCNLETAAGVRDRAILLLLVRLGLRAGEVAMLELEDIRWRSGEIVVRGKGCVVDHMPLLHEVGEAVASYLHTARPKNSSRRVFLRLCAPIGELAGRAAVSTVVRSAINRAGLNPPVRGSHLLRHTLGTHMIRAGASMTEIAEVLRHRSLGTTELYAKVAFESLRAIAQPWPAAGEVR